MKSRGTFIVQKCVLLGGTAAIDLATAWPADRVRALPEVSAECAQQTAWPGSAWIGSSAPRPRLTLICNPVVAGWRCMAAGWLLLHAILQN
jgi:hypothetical protein